jgi:hypothetical protein
VLQISKFSGGVHPQPPPIHAWYIGHTRGLQPLLSPSNILSHRKVPFQKCPPTGKSLKKALSDFTIFPVYDAIRWKIYSLQKMPEMWLSQTSKIKELSKRALRDVAIL